MFRSKLALLLLCGAALPALPAKAQLVYCSNCSTVWDDATSLANQARSLANDVTKINNQVTQITNQATQIQNQAHMLERLPSSVFPNHQTNLNDLNSIISRGNLLSGQINSTLTRLQGGGYPTSNLTAQQNQLSSTRALMGSNYQNLQSTLNTYSSQVTSDVDLLDQLTTRAQSTTGQHSAINVQNEYNSQIAGQLIKINQTLIALTQAIASQAAINHDRQGLIDEKAANSIGATLCTNCSQF
jgi:P-type conjugative transfer protein TrbJ